MLKLLMLIFKSVTLIVSGALVETVETSTDVDQDGQTFWRSFTVYILISVKSTFVASATWNYTGKGKGKGIPVQAPEG
jgi:p-aminobenzoyl-glutamate transporter AbgT